MSRINDRKLSPPVLPPARVRGSDSQTPFHNLPNIIHSYLIIIETLTNPSSPSQLLRVHFSNRKVASSRYFQALGGHVYPQNMSGRAPRPITDTNHSAYVVLSIWACFFSALLFWSVRIAYRWRRVGLRWDDASLIFAMVSMMAMDICGVPTLTQVTGTRPRPEYLSTICCQCRIRKTKYS